MLDDFDEIIEETMVPMFILQPRNLGVSSIGRFDTEAFFRSSPWIGFFCKAAIPVTVLRAFMPRSKRFPMRCAGPSRAWSPG